MSGLLVLAPLAIEAAAVRSGLLSVEVTGMGPRRSREAARHLPKDPVDHVAVVGFAGALDGSLVPGDVLVATEVRDQSGGSIACDGDRVASAMEREGVPTKRGVVLSVDHLVRGPERRRLRDTGADAVDMESYWLAPIARGGRFDVVRVVVDTPSHEILRPLHTLIGGVRAIAMLKKIGTALAALAERERA